MSIIFTKCPVCGKAAVIKKELKTFLGLLGNHEKIICENKKCGAVFKQEGEKTYRLIPSSRFENKYEGKSLIYDEWIRIADGGLSDEEIALEKLKNGELPVVSVDEPGIILKKFEIAHAKGSVEYYEEKLIRYHTGGYAGPSIRIAKGIYFRVGGYKGKSYSVPEIRHVDTGLMVITNERIIFSGEYKSFTIPLIQIVSVKEKSENLLQIVKEGRNKLFYFMCNAYVVKLVILSAIKKIKESY